MICVRLDGGLGNQLFQYAAGRALAIRHNTGLLLDTFALNSSARGVTARSLELYHYKHASHVSQLSIFRFSKWLRFFPKLTNFVSPWHMFVEDGLGFNNEFQLLPDMTYLFGYWQSYRYFSNVECQIVSDLTPVNRMSDTSKALEEKIDSCVSVAIHVRRGDYVSLPSASELHGSLPIDYYKVAVNKISSTVTDVRYFVFSDDPNWCRENLSLDRSAIYVTHNTGADSWQDLMLMACCKHHIIANSSFSWWGAWLADHRCSVASTRMVIAPARWFSGQPHHDLSDRFPQHWIIQ